MNSTEKSSAYNPPFLPHLIIPSHIILKTFYRTLLCKLNAFFCYNMLIQILFLIFKQYSLRTMKNETDTWIVDGESVFTDNILRLTDSAQNQNGFAWQETANSLQNFEVTFTALVSYSLFLVFS